MVDRCPPVFRIGCIAAGTALSDRTGSTSEVKVEAELYAPTFNFLALAFGDHLRRHARSGRPWTFPANVDRLAGSDEGRWTRPDLACLALARGEFVPFWRADLHTFEVKTASGLNVTAVHEANAHGRLGQFAWLAFQAVGQATRDTNLFGDILASAGTVGVGVISFQRPSDPTDWRVDLWPERTNTDHAVADAFVRERFGAGSQASIRRLLAAHGWPDMREPDDGL